MDTRGLGEERFRMPQINSVSLEEVLRGSAAGDQRQGKDLKGSAGGKGPAGSRRATLKKKEKRDAHEEEVGTELANFRVPTKKIKDREEIVKEEQGDCGPPFGGRREAPDETAAVTRDL